MSIFYTSTILYYILFQISGIRILITGSTGTLGRSLTKLCVLRGLHVIAGYRNHLKLQGLYEDFYRCDFVGQFSPVNMDVSTVSVEDLSSITSGSSHFVVFNNAGVCHKGSSAKIMKESLFVNSIAPIRIAQICLTLGIANPNIKNITVINVSSGDGEIALLHSDIQQEISSLNTLEEWENCIHQHINNYKSDFEYAYGSTPFYSLSKAFLNAGTRLLWKQFKLQHQVSLINTQYRVHAVCPGNFQSDMTSIDNDFENVTTPDEAAEHLLDLALDSSVFTGDMFIRKGEVIPW